jgi:serine/threonine protein kinase
MSTLKTLKQLLSQVRHKNVQNHYFIPSNSVLEVMKSVDIREILVESGLDDPYIEETVKLIRNGAWNVFAILALIREPQYIINFIKDDRLQRSSIDSRLPFELKNLKVLLGDLSAAEDFYDEQWGFAAPFFSGSIFNRVLPSEFILPYLQDQNLEGDEGGFGVVYRIQVEHSYQRFDDREPYYEVRLLLLPMIIYPNNCKLVRKELKPQRKESEYKLELRNLTILKLIQDPNIIELLGSYTYQGRHNLIFPLARGGTLSYFIKNIRPPSFKANEKVILALAGLCSAVRAVHKQFSEDRTLLRIGCHHDLKPKNIFIQDDKFLLADFGLSRFKDAAAVSDTSYKNVGGTYVAPECEHFDEAGRATRKTVIGRPSDVWSLGCIVMEVLVYMYFGPAGVSQFEDDREFQAGPLTLRRFHHGPNEQEPAVDKYLSQLTEKSSSRSHHLLIGLLRHILRLNPKLRPEADEIETRMRFIAIDTISEQIETLYSRLWNVGQSPQAFLEQHRFLSWLQGCKVLYGHEDQTSLDKWKARTPSEYQTTIDTLKLIRDTLETIIPEAEEPIRPVYSPLGEFNDLLIDALPDQLQRFARSQLEIQILSSKVHSSLVEMLQQSDGVDIQRIGTLAVLRDMESMIDRRSQTRRPDLWIMPERLGSRQKLSGHFISHLDSTDEIHGAKVLCESKRYGTQQLDPAIRDILHSRLEAIAELLQKIKAAGFRVLECIGYFHDPAYLSCGLVYRIPTALSSHDPDVSTLRAVLTDRKTPPILGQRFHLARRLALSLLEFHKSGWLQKELSSFNIAFVYPKGTSWRNGINEPYFLGFSNSRPNQPSAYTEFMDRNNEVEKKDFQHPEYLKGRGMIRYRDEFDYYSLGLVLFEIGLWKSLNTITKSDGSPEDMLARLKSQHIERLGENMGAIYRDVVLACLNGGFGESGEACMGNFARLVIKPLENCVV